MHIVNFRCRGPGCLDYYYIPGLSAGSIFRTAIGRGPHRYEILYTFLYVADPLSYWIDDVQGFI